MTEEETVKAVASRLAGEFYVGQRIKHAVLGQTGTVLFVVSIGPNLGVGVKWDYFKVNSTHPVDQLTPL